MNYRDMTRLALATGLLLALSGCTRSVSDVDSAGKTQNPVFPDPTSAVRTEGSFVNLANLKQMRPGLTKAQVYELIGTPHFKEGVFRVKEWDYIFHFTREDRSVLTCQYKVLFDHDMTAQSFFFQPQNCLDGLKPAKAVTPTVKSHQEMSAESLFAFGSATLTPEGREQVANLARTLKAQGLNANQAVVTGYTDRIGNAKDNERLSLARAMAVKDVLIAEGFQAANVETYGAGSAEPKAICPGASSPKVIACLAPNRRVTVDVMSFQAASAK